jgi:ubiquinone/menaquinone biosynthesis C-methylase UbiE
MDEKQLKAMLKETFDTVSGGYDSEALRFFQASAEHMAFLLGLQGNENVLDVACGTGNAALAIAKFLPTGQVTAVDFSSGMLDQARRKAASLDVRNVEFIERDMQNLKFSDCLFDVAVCLRNLLCRGYGKPAFAHRVCGQAWRQDQDLQFSGKLLSSLEGHVLRKN